MQIQEINSNTTKVIFSDERTLTLVGSAHISQESVEDVKTAIEEVNPDSICIELDSDRWDKYHRSAEQREKMENFDLVKLIKQGKFFLLIVNLILSTFQKRMSKNTTKGKVGMEIISAGEIAREKDIPLTFADRNVSTTLKRAWSNSSLWTKMKLIASLFASIFDRSDISEKELEELKQTDNIDRMLTEMSKALPTVKEVLIDERDVYLASKIYNAPGENKFVVVGKGHMKGLLANLEKLDKKEIDIDTSSLEITKAKKVNVFEYFIPVLLMSVLCAIGVRKGAEMGLEAFCIWVGCNAIVSTLGAVITFSHPVTWIVTAITSPIAALAPVLGVGMFSSITEATFRKVRVKDVENVQEDIPYFKMWYKNRILHTFLVFILTSIFSGIGSFVITPIVWKYFGVIGA